MIRTNVIEYGTPDNVFAGTICYDDEITEPKPGIMIAPTIRGHSDFEIGKAIELAKLGYLTFVVDMYGKEKRSDNIDFCRVWMNELNLNRMLLLQRISLAFLVFKNHAQIDKNKIGAIGYCFGGKCVLDLARAGADVNGVVSFHGVYDKPNLQFDSPLKSSVLVLHGWDDPLGTPPQLAELAKELTERDADWQILSYGNTAHSFTNPNADNPEEGLVYNELTDKRAWKAMVNFFEEIFE